MKWSKDYLLYQRLLNQRERERESLKSFCDSKNVEFHLTPKILCIYSERLRPYYFTNSNIIQLMLFNFTFNSVYCMERFKLHKLPYVQKYPILLAANKI